MAAPTRKWKTLGPAQAGFAPDPGERFDIVRQAGIRPHTEPAGDQGSEAEENQTSS